MSGWVELRVHGVSGTPPEDMLGSSHVVQVAGDERSRCFRPLDSADREVRGSQGQVLEAFHWGRWTSGSWAQALWMLLIPFGIVNAAQFMLPAPDGRWSRALHSVCGALLRLLALVLTGAFTIGGCVLLVDLGAWQWLLRRSFPVDDRVVLIAALLLAAAVGYALSLLGRSGRGAHYRFRTASARQGRPAAPAPGESAEPGHRLADLETPNFFDGDPDSPALRNLHRAAGLAIVAVLALAVAAESGNRWSVHVRWLPAGLLAVVAAVIVLLGDPEESATVTSGGGDARSPARDWWYGRVDAAAGARVRGASGWTSAGLLAASGAVLVLGGVAVATTQPRRRLGLPPVTGTLPGIDGTAAWAGIAGTIVVAALLVAVALLAASTTGSTEPIAAFRRFAGGMTAALAAAVGFFLGIGFTAGFSLFFQGVLNRLTPHYPARVLALLPADAPERIPPVKTPPVLQRVSYAWGITAGLILLLAIALGIWLAVRRSRFRRYARAAMTFGHPATLRLPERWLARVGTAMQAARLKNQLVVLFWCFAVAGVVLSLSAAFAYWHDRGLVCRPAPTPSARCYELLTGVSSAPGAPVTADDVVIGIGSFTLVALGTVLVAVTRGALRAEGPRRSLNVVWDVVAFWPRSVHPYVPAPYSQDVVPALVRRICWHLGEPDPFVDVGTHPRADGVPVNPAPADTVVVAAHSQGTLISLVALLWVPPEQRARVRWLTFGSQLRQQFPRAFPHYVTVALLRRAVMTHRWLSLYRDTDPIAGPVTSWGHTHDGDGVPRSYRLEDERLHDDELVGSTGRRECGREWRLLDPVPADPALQTGAVAAIRGHGDYWAGRQDWSDALAAVLGGGPGTAAAVEAAVPRQQGQLEAAEQPAIGLPSGDATGGDGPARLGG